MGLLYKKSGKYKPFWLWLKFNFHKNCQIKIINFLLFCYSFIFGSIYIGSINIKFGSINIRPINYVFGSIIFRSIKFNTLSICGSPIVSRLYVCSVSYGGQSIRQSLQYWVYVQMKDIINKQTKQKTFVLTLCWFCTTS